MAKKYSVLSKHLVTMRMTVTLHSCLTVQYCKWSQLICQQVKFSRNKILANISVEFIHVLFNYLGHLMKE